MKRFVFRLQRVYNYKLVVERMQRAELAEAVAALNALLNELARLDELILNGYSGAVTVRDFEEHAWFLERLRDERDELLPRIAAAEEHVEQCRAQLVQTMREIKTYDQVRAEKYAEWYAENTKSESAALQDYMAATLTQ